MKPRTESAPDPQTPSASPFQMKTFRLLLALVLATVAAHAADVAKKPSILWLTAEDMGPDSVSCYGAPQTSTPNLDKLAANGVRYTRAYSTAPVCSASRSAFMTGMY